MNRNQEANRMLKYFYVFLFAIVIHAEFTFAQNRGSNSIPLQTIDSVFYYFNKSLNTDVIDTGSFYKGLDLINKKSFSPDEIKSLKDYAAELKNQGNHYFASYLYATIFEMLTNMQDYDAAINFGKEIINQYDANPNPNYRELFLYMLKETRNPYNKSDRQEEGFAFYTPKLKHYLHLNDSAAISSCYFVMGKFYRNKGFYDLAIYSTKKSLAYVDTTNNLDAIWTLMDRLSFIGLMYIDVGDYQNAISNFEAAKEVRVHRLHDVNISFIILNIAYAKLMLNQTEGLLVPLHSALNLAYERKDWPSFARGYEIKGFYFLKMNQIDSAEQNLFRCKDVMTKYGLEKNFAAGVLMPDYYLAQIRVLQNRVKEARELIEPDIKRLSNFKYEALKEYKLLVELYLQLGDAKSAGVAFRKYSELQARITEEDRKNRFLSFETENKITEAENTIGTLESEKKLALLIRNFTFGIAVLLMIVAGIIFNRFRVTRRQKVIIEKEKQRSEELLLNILPSEVAEELKAKGSAEAKHFNEVTVMFTDFKGFTQISERLSPAALVAEIDYCFKAFDNIISKHNIEKIKTIGDAYMCAGGLPVSNQTHATDVVKAAMEIQNFMQMHLQRRKNEGKEVFEIRIGIHTGPVVAGIVGVKKFAYDIWGDTVNIASRMESSSETGRVNISGSTYELVKDKFKFIHRGKIQAKNKGEIDMYFVEPIS